MVPDIENVTADHSPVSICATTEVAVLEGTSDTFPPATQQLTPFISQWTPHYSSWHNHTLSDTHHFSCMHHSCHSISLKQLPPHNKRIPTHESQAKPKTLNPHNPHCLKTVIIQDSHSDFLSDSSSESDLLNY